jgi:hypothetical protein
VSEPVFPLGGGPTDFDGDGITDAVDACVEVPRAADGNGDGCPDRPAALPDTDGDGIPNSADACDTTPAGPTDANEDGCPDGSEDVDGDGLPNATDACPGTPAGGNDANGDGCPDPAGGGGGGTGTATGTGGGDATATGGSPGDTMIVPDTLAPTARVVARPQRALRRKAIVFTASCSEACKVTVTAHLGKSRLGRVTKRLSGGANTQLKIKLSEKSQAGLRKALKRRKTIKATLNAVAVDGAGNKRTASKKVAIKR